MIRTTPHPPLGTHPLWGGLCAILSVMFLGVNPSLLKLAYFEGTGVLFAVFMRGAVAVVLLLVYSQITRRRLNILRLPKKAFALISISMLTTAFCYMTAILFISPNLAVVLLYLFPIFVLGIRARLARQWPKPLTILTYLTAFVGLALVVGIDFERIDWRGVSLALLSAAAVSLLFFVKKVGGDETESHAPIFAGSVMMALAALSVMLIFDRITVPQSLTGWALVMTVSCFYTVGYVLIITATHYLRPDLTSLLMNVEPLIGGFTAFVLLGDVLTPLQIFGVFTVTAAISLGGWLARHEGKQA